MSRGVQWAAGKFQLCVSTADVRSSHQRPGGIPEVPWSELSWWQYTGLYCSKVSRCSLSVLSKQRCMIAHLLLTDERVWDTAQVGCSSVGVRLQSLQSCWVWTLSGAEPALRLLGSEWLEYISIGESSQSLVQVHPATSRMEEQHPSWLRMSWYRLGVV